MTKDDIQKQIDKIIACSGDDERQHSYEDKLRDDFIQFIANNSKEYGELARQVLGTNEIDFARWCA